MPLSGGLDVGNMICDICLMHKNYCQLETSESAIVDTFLDVSVIHKSVEELSINIQHI
jgi:hypothetical protein